MTGTVGIDVGGTFTDLYFSGSDTRPPQILKVPSTPPFGRPARRLARRWPDC